MLNRCKIEPELCLSINRNTIYRMVCFQWPYMTITRFHGTFHRLISWRSSSARCHNRVWDRPGWTLAAVRDDVIILIIACCCCHDKTEVYGINNSRSGDTLRIPVTFYIAENYIESESLDYRLVVFRLNCTTTSRRDGQTGRQDNAINYRAQHSWRASLYDAYRAN